LESVKDWSGVITLLSYLVRSCITGQSSVASSTLLEGGVPLQDGDAIILNSIPFLTRLITLKFIKDDPISSMASHLAFDNFKTFTTLLDRIITRINDVDYVDFYSSLRIFNSLIGLKDSFNTKRVEYAVPMLMNVIESNQNYYKATEICINFLVNIAANTPSVKELIVRNKDWCRMIEEWLKKNRNPPAKKAQMKMYKFDNDKQDNDQTNIKTKGNSLKILQSLFE